MNGWREFTIGPLAADDVHASPYVEWAEATGFAYYGPSDWLPLLIELRESPLCPASAPAFARFVLDRQALAEKAPPWAQQVLVPDFFASPPRRLVGDSPFISVLARREFIDAMRTDRELAQSIRQFELGAPSAFAAAPRAKTPPPSPVQRAQPVQQAQSGGGAAVPQVLVAIIDDGIPFAHDRLAAADGRTRIEYAFDQRWPLAPWYFGRELSKRDPLQGIDVQAASSRYAGIVDEEQVYRRTAALDLARRGHKPLLARASHGAAVADLACSCAQPPPAGQRPVIAVQLPTATVADTSGATLGPQVLAALWYIAARADDIRVGMPVVVNLSYGTIAGPHDGSSLFERAMDSFIAACGSSLRLVLPAGNNYQSRCHARFSIAPGGVERLPWRVLPDDRTESELQIWLPPGSPSLQLVVTAPDGRPTTPFGWGSGRTLLLNGKPVGRVGYHAPGSLGTRSRVHIVLAPTADPAGRLALAPAGLWLIELRHVMGSAPVQHIDAWIQRDDAAPGYPRRGRQSYFDDPRYARFDDGGRLIDDDAHPLTQASIVRREGTLNAIATGREPVVVGGFRRSDGTVAVYSGSGPLVGAGRLPPNAQGPEALLPSEESAAQPGLMAAGTRSASVTILQGTSAAAPLAAHWLAEEAAAGRPNDRHALFQAAVVADNGPAGVPVHRRGGGRLAQPMLRRPPR